MPLTTAFEVIDFPAYWFVCPPRHFNRRIVTRFADWIAQMATEHETQARALLAGMGCRFRAEAGPVLL